MADEKSEPEKAVDVMKDITLIAEIVQVGTEMRHWQKTFFKDRTDKSLQEAKKSERQFDKLMERYSSKQSQKNLFE